MVKIYSSLLYVSAAPQKLLLVYAEQTLTTGLQHQLYILRSKELYNSGASKAFCISQARTQRSSASY